MKNKRHAVEMLESRHCLSAVTFVTHVVSDQPIDVFNIAVHAVDVDGDGDLDVISGDYPHGKIAWYENIDGQFEIEHGISNSVGASSVFPADLDGDGDFDLLVGEYTPDSGSSTSWYDNIDGQGTFRPRQMIDDYGMISLGGRVGVNAVDVDNDGDLDLLAGWGIGSFNPDETGFAWYENTNGEGLFGPQQSIANTEIGYVVMAADLDADGDADALSGGFGGFSWFENRDASFSLEDRRRIGDWVHSPMPNSLDVADIDGDGDTDLLVASNSQVSSVFWLENMDGRGTFGLTVFGQPIRTIANGRNSQSAHAADVDDDGDPDAVVAADGKAVWYENIDGKGQFGPSQVISEESLGYVNSVFPADLDGDGDVDVLSASFESQIVWHENRIIGDSNNDGIFDSSDLVTVFGAGKFETVAQATFDEGDWNQDGVFDSGDMVLAFQTGHYIAASMPMTKTLAAAIDQLFSDEEPGH